MQQCTPESKVPSGDTHLSYLSYRAPSSPHWFQDSLCQAGWSVSHSTSTSPSAAKYAHNQDTSAKRWRLEVKTALFLIPLTPSAEVELK